MKDKIEDTLDTSLDKKKQGNITSIIKNCAKQPKDQI